MHSFTPPNPQYKERVLKKLEGQAFMEHVGIQITAIEAGRVEAELEIRPIHKQQFGRIHGGLTGVLADIVTGFAVYTLAPEDKDVVTIELKTSYLRAGKGQRLKAVGQVLKPGRAVSFAEGKIYALDGDEERLIATSTTSMALIPRNTEYEPYS